MHKAYDDKKQTKFDFWMLSLFLFWSYAYCFTEINNFSGYGSITYVPQQSNIQHCVFKNSSNQNNYNGEYQIFQDAIHNNKIQRISTKLFKPSLIFGCYHFFCFGVMPIVLLKLTIFQVTVQ
jgi:hypothetical protein